MSSSTATIPMPALWVACEDYMHSYIQSRLRASEDPFESSSCRSFPTTIFCGDCCSEKATASELNADDDDDSFVEDVPEAARASWRRKANQHKHKHDRRDSSLWSEMVCGDLGDSSVLASVCSAVCFVNEYFPDDTSSISMHEQNQVEQVITSQKRYPAIEVLYHKDAAGKRRTGKEGI